MSALEEYNAARVGMPTSIQTVVNQRKADAAINELLAEVERLKWMLDDAAKRHYISHAGSYDGPEGWLADLAARYDARPKDGDG